MKRFFARVSKTPPSPPPPKSSPSPNHSVIALNPAAHHSPGLQPKDVIPAVPHPCPHDHLALLATADGLLIRPQPPHYVAEHGHVRIGWGKAGRVEEVRDGEISAHENLDWTTGVVIYGIVGILELFSGSYLLVITARSEVGTVIDDSHIVYGVRNVVAIPLVEGRARKTITMIAARNATLSRPSLFAKAELEPDDHDAEHSANTSPHVQSTLEPDIRLMTPHQTVYSLPGEDEHPRSSLSPQSSSSDISIPSSENSTTSPINRTLADRLSFWNRISKRASVSPPALDTNNLLPTSEAKAIAEEQQVLDEIIKEGKRDPSEVLESILATTAPPPSTDEERHSELEDKIIRECIKEFTKGDMYFAYNFDVTRSLQHKQEQVLKAQKQHDLLAGLGALSEKSGARANDIHENDKVSTTAEPYPTLPLWRRVDKQFWWNEWLSKPFIDAGLHSYVLPIMQGYFQLAQFNIPPDRNTHDTNIIVDYIIISRRSRDRAGLRYQRRGIDEGANVANFVETETIMRVEREGKDNIFSYVQIRGSIPLFWTQTGYGLKPPPVLAADRTHEQNLDALKRHLSRTIPRYGPLTIVNLAEQHGKEGAITQGYREYMHELSLKDAHYCEYDFHNETKGMKYENISKLINSMERTFEAQGYMWISNNVIFSQQKGVFRVNCIDCLDRTNVVQSAFARYVLNKQLSAVALLSPSSAGRSETDIVFNDVWANNGDVISKAYAGTSALKGDFTRTGKRDLGGMLNDGVNSLARMYTSTFSDWFSQAVIDFMLGSRTITVFSEFLLKLQSTDPRDLIRISKIRTEAIATSVSRVLSEGERLLSGWTLFSPEELNKKLGLKFEEKVVLLSVKALYIVSYDYTLEKVKLYTRVPLGDVVKISKGAYIISPLEEASRDPEQNAGFTVTWLNSNQESRITSYSVRNSLEIPTSSSTFSTGNLGKVAKAVGLTGKSSLPRAQASTSTAGAGDMSFAAFKVLPIDLARIRRSSSAASGYSEASDELVNATTCWEAVDSIVESIQQACEDLGNVRSGFVIREDVVGLTEAQRMTSVYAKMEYGVKRLLWLGG